MSKQKSLLTTPAEKSTQDKEVLLLIDSFALIHRAFHAFKPDLTTSSGEVINAVYGFTRLLLEVLTKFKPKYVLAAMDSHGPTLRHDSYGQYKANRKPADELLTSQIPRIVELLSAFGIPVLMQQGYEADDIIGTLDLAHSGPNNLTIIVTGDRDLFQLVDEDTNVYMAGSAFSESKLYDIDGVTKKMGVRPDQIVDFKSIMGDASDNIPGVAGIGEKGAQALLQEFDNLKSIYENLENVPKKYQEKLKASVEMAYKSQELATILRDAPIHFDLEDAKFGSFDVNQVVKLFQTLEFRSLLLKPAQLKQVYGFAGSEAQSESLADLVSEELKRPNLSAYNQEELSSPMYISFTANTEKDPLTWNIESAYICDKNDKEFEISSADLANLLAKLNAEDLIVTHEAKVLLHFLINSKQSLKAQIYDVVMSEYLISEGRCEQDLTSAVMFAKLSAANTLDAVKNLYLSQQQRLTNLEKVKNVVNLENNLVKVIAQMEQAGITLNVDLLKEYDIKLTELIKKKEEDIFYSVGHEFNVGSPKQVGQVLFEEINLPGLRKTKTGGYSTDERTLKELVGAHPVVQQILDYRELTKLLSTYVKPLPMLVNPQTGRLHTNYRQLGAVTGRFASVNPNLQNIPLNEVEGINMRESFVAAKDCLLVAFDYSQQELRLLAELSNEEAMLEAFTSGVDIHAATAADIFEIPLESVSKEQRKIGKTINFGVVYGISAFGLADRLKIDNRKAAEFINKYFITYPKIKTYYQNLLAEAKATGYVETILGRRRNAKDLLSANARLRQAVEREVQNFPLQGSAADIIKSAMVALAPVLEKYPVKMLLQVHDELVFEYNGLDLENAEQDQTFAEFLTEVKDIMLDVIKVKVPFAVGIEYGHDWANMREWSE